MLLVSSRAYKILRRLRSDPTEMEGRKNLEISFGCLMTDEAAEKAQEEEAKSR
jgi:hypothetical protein